MPIIEKCQKCEREGGYATHKNDEICARCVKSSAAADGTNAQDQNNDNPPAN